MTFEAIPMQDGATEYDGALASAKSASRLCIIPFIPFLLLFSEPAGANAVSTGFDDPVASEHVRLDDLDLQTKQGWRSAKSRVASAAARVCAMQLTFSAASRCRKESVTRGELALVRYAAINGVHLSSTPIVSASIRSRVSLLRAGIAARITRQNRYFDRSHRFFQAEDAA